MGDWPVPVAAQGRCHLARQHTSTPAGDAVVSFSPANEFGILDHRVSIAGQPEIYIPLRMIENGAGTTVQFTLFRQPEMDDAAFEADATLVQADLDTLKALLEARHSASLGAAGDEDRHRRPIAWKNLDDLREVSWWRVMLL